MSNRNDSINQGENAFLIDEENSSLIDTASSSLSDTTISSLSDTESSSLSDTESSLSNNDYEENGVTNLLRDIIRTSTARSVSRDYSFYLNILEDPLDRIMRESLDSLPSYYIKTNREINIKSITYNENINPDKNTSCTICLYDFNEEDIVSKLPNCMHMFHVDCIKEWGYYKTTCPTCRSDI